MKPLFILLAQSVTGSVIEIVLLLLVAGLIGYFTTWFYAKSVYTPIIKGLKEEKTELNRQILGLKDDISKLNGTADKLNEKIGKLEEEIAEKDKEVGNLKNTTKGK
jgi:peptidoglycan hydrolase CwlO-like protein